MSKSVGIIGNGFVGDAVAHGIKAVGYVPLIYDANPNRSEVDFEVAACCDYMFVCVPTPTSARNGDQDTSILDDVVSGIAMLQSAQQPVGTVVIKSTVLPGVVNEMRTRYSTLRFVSNPEFLTERSARSDFVHPSRVVLGASRNPAWELDGLVALYERLAPDAPRLIVTHDEAALIKYASNCFFATKISFLNELKQICDVTQSSYDAVRNGLVTSGWVNPMHTLVPGPDCRLGFGGKCFPKDLAAFARYGTARGVRTTMMRSAIAKNFEVREDHDWTRIDGAFSCD